MLFPSIARNPLVCFVKVIAWILELAGVASKSAHTSRIVSRILERRFHGLNMTAAIVANALKVCDYSGAGLDHVIVKAQVIGDDIAKLNARTFKRLVDVT